jgi:hypothetical protein
MPEVLFNEDEDRVVIQHPFVIVVEPGDVVDGKLQWFAKIMGHELDNMTWADTPLEAVQSAMDLLKELTSAPRYS